MFKCQTRYPNFVKCFIYIYIYIYYIYIIYIYKTTACVSFGGIAALQGFD